MQRKGRLGWASKNMWEFIMRKMWEGCQAWTPCCTWNVGGFWSHEVEGRVEWQGMGLFGGVRPVVKNSLDSLFRRWKPLVMSKQ